MPPADEVEPILVKRYADSRLYDTTNEHWVSIEQLQNWAADNIAFTVIDSRSGANVTRLCASWPENLLKDAR